MKKKRWMALLTGVLAVSVLAGCTGIDKDAAVAVLDGKEISLGVANFAARLQQAQYDDFYTAYFGQDVWTADLYGNGTTMQDNLKDTVMESLQNMYVLQDHMAEYEIVLSDEETAQIKKTAEEFMAANETDALHALGAEEEIVEQYLTLLTVQTKMYDAIVADTDTNVSDEEANTSAYSYVRISKVTYTDAEGTTQEYTEEEQTELADTVKEFQKAAKIKTLEDAAEEYGYTVSAGTFSSDTTTLDTEVLDALEALKEEGKLSDVVETTSYYYVLRLDAITDEDATQSHREEIITQRQQELYEDVLSGWKEASEWTLKEKTWAKVTFDNLFTTVVPSTETVDETEQR